jgi:hypothetical protein
MKKIITNTLAVLTLGTAMVAPSMASAQSWRGGSYQHRQDQKNQWKNLAIGAGAVGLLGILTHNNTLTLGGLAGAAYSGYRYDQKNRNSSSRYRNERYDSNRWDYSRSRGRRSR